jgi:uncharacterized membrane protein
MNRMLVAIFPSEQAAEAGSHALRQLHAEGDITLYAMGVIAKDAKGHVSVKQASGQAPLGTGVGLVVGSMLGLLGGPVGLAVGAVAGTMAGAVRDFWVAGVGLDFVEETERLLTPGKVAVIAEVEEDWILPVDSKMEAAGGIVFRRTRAEVATAEFDRDIVAVKSDVAELKNEVKHATGEARTRLQAKVGAATTGLEDALQRAKHRVDELEHEAQGRLAAIETQLARAEGNARASLERRVKHVRSGYEARSRKLGQAWGLAKEALTA